MDMNMDMVMDMDMEPRKKIIRIDNSFFQNSSEKASSHTIKNKFKQFGGNIQKGVINVSKTTKLWVSKLSNPQNPFKNVNTAYLVFGTCISLYVLFYVGIRLRHPFWMKQPVLHHHDIFLKMKAPCIISTDLPPKNRYVNSEIRFRKYNDLSSYDRTHFFNLVSEHYLRSNASMGGGAKEDYRPTEASIFTYFQHLTIPSFFSLYYDNVDLKDENGDLIPEKRRLVGAMTTRPLQIFLKNENSPVKEYPLYYVDWLCVHSAHRKQGIAPQIIYSHTYFQQRTWGKSAVYLFKREGKHTPIVPLTKYMTYGFDFEKGQREYGSADITKEHILVKKMLSGELNLVKNMLENIKNDFQCIIYPDDPTLKNMIKSGLIYVFAVYMNQTPIGCVFCRNSHTYIAKNTSTDKEVKENTLCVEIFASYFPTTINQHNVMICFDHICDMMKTNLKCRYIVIENIAHNNLFIAGCLARQSPLFRTPHNYYLYNFAQKTLLSDKVFIVN